LSVRHWRGIVQSADIRAITALIGCHIGFRTEGGAEGVGRSTIRSFVLSAILILVFDFILGMIFF